MAIFTDFKNGTRKIWNTINHLKSDHKKNYLNYISHNIRILKDPLDIAEALMTTTLMLSLT